ncbi:MAG TPA: hypothetical protein VMS21_06900 [Methylomirabilota bacterium]|nr:hypothetical protein [Methylomirabilota bacterium]
MSDSSNSERFHALDATRAFAILIASHHYLVRSTFIGRVLNGRSHPFVAWPRVTNTAFASAANATPANPGTQTP